MGSGFALGVAASAPVEGLWPNVWRLLAILTILCTMWPFMSKATEGRFGFWMSAWAATCLIVPSALTFLIWKGLPMVSFHVPAIMAGYLIALTVLIGFVAPVALCVMLSRHSDAPDRAS